ncbi:collagen binding domain-containing protein [Paenibacillus sp. LjRoot56]|uniref:collagen binding domain-containing protein n=1 Tax=Paenibacillus sp. LjRoot56 TaxID=3342333 RepID=UPI003ECF592F
MVKKQTKALLIALLMFMQCLYGITLSSQVNATEISGNILDSVTLAVYDSNGQVVTGNVYNQNAQAKLDYTWSLPNGHGYHNGDTFTFTLPQEFELFNNVSGALVIDNSSTVGNFHANKDSHHVVITFNEFIESHDDLKGTLSFLTQFNKSQITGTTEQTIVIPVRSGDQIFTIKFRPAVDSTISKSGVPQGYNAKSINWTVDVNKLLDTVQDAVMTDPNVEGLSTPTGVKVYALNVQLDGTVTQGAELDSSQYTVSTTGGVLTVHFTNNPITSAYRIQYVTNITDLSKSSFTNTAKFGGSHTSAVEATSSVAVQRGSILKKEITDYQAIQQKIDWSVLYNGGEVSISEGNAYIIDTVSVPHQLVDGSLHVYPVTFDAGGNETRGAVLSADQYTITPMGESGNIFKLKFKMAITGAYRIDYQTQATRPIIADAVITNEVTIWTEEHSSASQNTTQVGLIKNVGAVNYIEKKVGWKIELNGNSQVMNHVVVKDTFPHKGMYFIEDSLVITQGNVTLHSPADFTLDNSVSQYDGFTINFTKPLTQPVIITYQTNFDLTWIVPKDSTAIFHNTAQMDWSSTDEVTYSQTVGAAFYARDEYINSGYKYGNYNVVNKQLTWTVGVNYSEKEIASPRVEDVLQENQKFVDGSLVVYNMDVTVDGDPSPGTVVDASRYGVSTDAQNKLVVTFHEPLSTAYIIVFKTSLEGELIPSTVANTAKVYDGQSPVSRNLTASVNIPHGGEYVSKNGSQSGDKIDWKITINQGQSQLWDAEIFDRPSRNQVLLSNSFHLFSMKVAANGDLTKDVELVKDVGYTVDIQTDTEGNQTFRLKFKSYISTAFVLEYQSVIAARDQESVTNAVSFSGNNVTTITKETVKDIVVGVSTGSGTGNGVRGSLEVKKVDATNTELPLSGAKYELSRKSGQTTNVIQTSTTNEAGIAIFQGLLAGDYVIKEVTAPSGYILDGSDHPFTLQAAENKKVTYTNSKTPPPTTTPTPPPSSTPSPTPPPSTTPTPTPPPSSTPTPPPSSTPTSPPTPPPSLTPSPSITPAPKPTPPLATVPSPKPSDPGVVVPLTAEPATLPVTGESSHLYIKLAGLTFVLFGVMLGRKVRRRR